MGRAIGIDLGTSNIVVSYYDKKGKLKNFKEKGEVTIPSAIYLKSKNEIEIGEEALNLGKLHPRSLITNYKYDIGDNKKTQYIAENGDRVSLNSTIITSLILREVLKKVTKKIMKEFPGEDIDEAVITVPAKFNPNQKQNTKMAARKAGLQNVKIAKESTAAAIAYAEQTEDLTSKLVVYDFGGGTFDVSIIEKTSNGSFKELATPQGDRYLGGNLITKRLADYIFSEIEEELPLEICRDRNDFDPDDYDYYPESVYLYNYSSVYSVAEKIKKEFAETREIEEDITLKIPEQDQEKIVNFHLSMKFEKFLELIEKDIDKTIEIVNRVIVDSGENKENVAVILTGGSSLLKPVQIKLEEYFGRDIEVYRPATLISEGATTITENINGIQMEGRLPNDIGIKVFESLERAIFEPILYADTLEKDADATKDFLLTTDNQQFLRVQLYERDIKNYPNAKKISDEGCTEIETLKIDLPPNLKKSETIIKLRLQIEDDGTLSLEVSLYDDKGNKMVDENLVLEKENIFE